MAIRPDERRLEEPLLTELVGELDGWSSDGVRIEKTFAFEGFKGAIAFVGRIADAANAADHHPDIHVEGYNNVRVVTTTHACSGLSRADISLARAVDAAVEAPKQP